AAPEGAVRPEAGAVEDERERGAGLAVLGEAGGRVRVAVLDADELRVLLERPLRGEVLRVEVVRHHLRPDAEHAEVELEVGAEGPGGLLAVEVAEVRREERLLAPRDAEGRLQLPARGDERPRRRHRERERAGRVAAGAAQDDV